MILKTSEKEIEVRIAFSKARRFQNEVCKDDETLLTLLPTKMMEKDNADFLIKVINTFQCGEKLSEEEIENFLDKYFEENENEDFYSLYSNILKEFDVSGIFKRGMGFKMATAIQKKMEEIQDKMEEVTFME